jgi:dehydrogenase/reductase SDR family member 1
LTALGGDALNREDPRGTAPRGSLKGTVAIATGASRGIGKGVALGLGEAGCTVYVTGRTLRNGDSDRPGSITATAQEIDELGGTGIPVKCDHGVDSQVESVFQRIADEQHHLDILVNNATLYSLEYGPREDLPFWELPVNEWDMMHAVGLRSHYVASRFAARMMTRQSSGLIINISSIGSTKYTGNVSYNVVKAGVDMLTIAAAEELRKYNVAVVSLWPRLTRTEGVLAHPELFADLSNSWSPIFSGRAAAALAMDPRIMEKSGHAFQAPLLSKEYEFTDVDGKRAV